MKAFIFLFFFCTSFIYAQSPRMSVKTKMDIRWIQKNSPLILKGEKAILEEIPYAEIDGKIYISFIGKLVDESYSSSMQGIIIGKGVGKIRSLRIRLDLLNAVFTISGFEYIELAGKIQSLLSRTGLDTRADSVHLGLNLPQSFTGRNVLLGINDWGFDYTHPMFYDTLLQQTRILAAWDQFKRSGPHPTGFDYGAEYVGATQLLVAETDTSNQLGHSTHATHVAGIAGGSGAGVISKGMAFDANFLFTTILVDEAAALDSWYWMFKKAEELNRRLIVNMSWGLYHFGTCDGTSLLSQAINEYTDQGILFVAAAGNNGNVNFHIEKNFNNDSLITKVDFYNYAAHDSLWGQSLHAWGEVGKSFDLQLRVRQGMNVVAQTPVYSSSLNGFDEGYLQIGNDTIWYDIAAQAAHPQNDRPTARLRVKNKNTIYQIDLIAKASTGKVHLWNLVELTTNGGNWGMPFSKYNDTYTQGDRNYGVGEPASAIDALTVASHSPEYLNTIWDSIMGGARSGFSSIGPLYNGVMKPDLSAPGGNILSSINSFETENTAASSTVIFNGRTYKFGRLSGTSMASPAAAGVCALIWEANPYLNARQVKWIAMSTAREDHNAGSLPDDGDVRWGHGKINAMAAVKKALNTVGLEEVVEDIKWTIYPNPCSKIFKVNGLENLEQINLINLSGKIYEVEMVNQEVFTINLPAGLYVVRIIANGRVYQQKVIIGL